MVDIDEVWRRRTDEQLLNAARVLDEYTEEGRRAIQAELVRRGIATEPVAIQNALDETSGAGHLASLGDRLLGQILDSAIAIVPLFGSVILDAGEVAFVTSLLFALSYMLFADGFQNGQSYGKRFVKTAVVHATSGTPCSLLQSFVRNFLLLALGVIDWIFIFGDRRQRLGDKLARTKVIYAGSR